MDTSKLGIATARAMDELEQLQEIDEIPEGAEIGAVAIVIALDRQTPEEERHPLSHSVTTQFFLFSEPDQMYVSAGLLTHALRNYGPVDEYEDE